MMEVVFKKSDFILCDVPVPKGYPQSQSHCTIKYHNGTLYLTTSPYPVIRRKRWETYFWLIVKKLSLGLVNIFYNGEDFENPLIYKGCSNNSDLFPTKFDLLKNCPLMDKPEDKYGLGSYCSDPDLFIDDGVFYVLNRTSARKSNTGNSYVDYETSIFLIEGKPNGDAFNTKKIHFLFNSQDASPCIAKYNNNYFYFSLDTTSYNTGAPCKSLNMRKRIGELWDWSEPKTINLENGIWEPWHMSVFNYNNKLFAIVACIERGVKQRCWQILGQFNEDLSELKLFQKPLTDFNSYRGSAIVTEEGYFILYNTTVYEKIKGGTSVDGREIIMAYMPFEELLSQLQ